MRIITDMAHDGGGGGAIGAGDRDEDDDEDKSISHPTSSTSTTSGEDPSQLPPPANTTTLNCGYNCSRYIYNQPVTRHTYDMLTDEDRVVIKDEYYRTYDLMTGLRTAASLGGTIVLFSLFILYKMKCRHGGGGGHRRRKSLAPSSVIDIGHQRDLEKELSLPISVNRSSFGGGNSNDLKSPPPPPPLNVTSGGSRRDSQAVFESMNPERTGSLGVCGDSGGGGNAKYFDAASVHGGGAVPRFRLNSEPDEDRHNRMSSACNLIEPSIDIHIIQPTPNVSPCGSVRRLSEDVDGPSATTSTAVFIPLLSIPKTSRTSKDRSAATTSRARLSRERRIVDADDELPHATTVDCVCSSNALPTIGDNYCCGGARGRHPSNNNDRHSRRRRPSNVEMKYIDCSDSDNACSSECLGDSQPTTPTTLTLPPPSMSKFVAVPEVHQAGLDRRCVIVAELDTPTTHTNVEDVSETQC